MLITFQVNVRDMTKWSSYVVGGETYLVLLYEHQVGPITTPLESSGAGRPVALGNIAQTVLFRWQGAAVLVQVINNTQSDIKMDPRFHTK